MSKWISTKDDMPYYDEPVLVCLRTPDYVGRVQFGRRLGPAGVRKESAWEVAQFFPACTGDLEELSDEEITHWRPLPKPPKED